MALKQLWITDFRCFESAELVPSAGVTVIQGPNGSGKTSLLEAVGLLATMRSFRVAAREALVRRGADSAIVRAEVDQAGRPVLIEAEIPIARPWRFQANRQVVRRLSDLGGALRVSVFSPDDLELVQGSPSARREFLDASLITGDLKMEATVGEVDRVLRHRAALLRQSGQRGRAYRDRRAHDTAPEHPAGDGDTGRGDTAHTFDVWDERLASSGTRLVEAREQLVEDLTGPASAAYRYLSGRDSKLAFDYRRSWQGELLDALREGRADDLKHQRTGSGPHRDELVILLDGMPARTHASQGEQRCVALALRLASHELATTRFGDPPTLLLDDVFSELDDNRAALLAECLPKGQVLLATAVDPPSALSGSVVNVVEIGNAPKRSDAE
jgi:DNA replication and repair protein RecF